MALFPEGARVSKPVDLDSMLNRFVQGVQTRRNRQMSTARVEAQIIKEKQEVLLPVREFLRRLVDMGVVVTNTDRFGVLRSMGAPPQHFSIYENGSSPSWGPGVSLFFDHPGRVEIAVPNQTDVSRLGVVVIRCVSETPEREILEGPFTEPQQAVEALLEFLYRHTERIDNPRSTD